MAGRGPWAQLAARIKAYREVYEAAGHPGLARVFLGVPAYLAEPGGRARAEAEDSIMSFFRSQAELGRDSARRAGGDIAVQRLRQGERPEAPTYDGAPATPPPVHDPPRLTGPPRAGPEENGPPRIPPRLNCGGRP